MSSVIEFNQVDMVEVRVTFKDGTSKVYSESDIGGDFAEWLSDINYDKRAELESEVCDV